MADERTDTDERTRTETRTETMQLIEPEESMLVNPRPGDGIFANGMTIGQLAKTIERSGCFGQCNAYMAAVKIMAGKEIGLGPIESMRGLHVFDGKIELGAAAMSSKIKGSGRYDYEVKTHDSEGCTIKCFEKSARTGQWAELPEISFTREEAERAKLLKKDNWTKYFEDMCFSRVMSRFFRRYCPHLAGGAVYGEGEVSTDLPPNTGRDGGFVKFGDPGVPAKPAQKPPEGGAVQEAESPAPAAQPAQEEATAAVDPTVAGATSATDTDNPATAETFLSAEETATTTEPPTEDLNTEPVEHPYGRFCRELELIKGNLVSLDGHDQRYRAILKSFKANDGNESRQITSRADVPKGATKLQREIVLALYDGITEAQKDKAEAQVEAEIGVRAPGSAVTVEAVNEQTETLFGMDPDFQPKPANDD